MSTKITLEYFGFQGQGATVKEAKQDAGRKIEALHAGTFQPQLREWRGEAVLVYRTLTGWEYTFIQHQGGALRTHGTAMGDGEFFNTLRSAERHLVGVAWNVGDPLTDFPEWFHNEEDRKDLISSREWQIAYRKFKDEGHEDNEAHRLATESRYSRQGLSA